MKQRAFVPAFAGRAAPELARANEVLFRRFQSSTGSARGRRSLSVAT